MCISGHCELTDIYSFGSSIGTATFLSLLVKEPFEYDKVDVQLQLVQFWVPSFLFWLFGGLRPGPNSGHDHEF